MNVVVEPPAPVASDRVTPRTGAESPFGAGIPVVSAASPMFAAFAASVVKPS